MINNKKQSGFSLIEVSIILIIAGLLLSAFFQIKKIVDTNEIESKYHFAVIDAGKKLEEYALLNGRYPLPASFTVLQNDSQFGVPLLPANLPDFSAGECDSSDPAINGVFCRPGNGNPNVTNLAEQFIYIGALPTSVLGINSEEGTDIFKGRYTYAISAGLTDAFLTTPADIYDDDNGVITVLSQETNTPALNKNNAHYVVISHGFNQSGSYLPDGTKNNCPTTLNNWEEENCDFDNATFYALTQRLIINEPLSSRNTLNSVKQLGISEGSLYFDDAVHFENTVKGSIWTARSATQINMTSGDSPGLARMLVGSQDYTTRDMDQDFENVQRPQVWVNGNLRVQSDPALELSTGEDTGNILTQRLCNRLFRECFKVADLTQTGVLINEQTGRPKTTKCENTALTQVVQLNRDNGRKGGKVSEADGVCRFNTQLTNLNEFGPGCTGGARGIDTNGNFICY